MEVLNLPKDHQLLQILRVGKIIRTYKGISDPLADRCHFLWDYRRGLPDIFEGFRAQGERERSYIF